MKSNVYGRLPNRDVYKRQAWDSSWGCWKLEGDVNQWWVERVGLGMAAPGKRRFLYIARVGMGMATPGK